MAKIALSCLAEGSRNQCQRNNELVETRLFPFVMRVPDSGTSLRIFLSLQFHISHHRRYDDFADELSVGGAS